MEKMLSHPFMYLLTLLPIFVILFHSCEGDVTVSPALACVGEQVRVQCSLNAPNGDMFVSPEIMFIVGNSDTPLTENDVNNGVGDPLNRLTAFGDFSSSSNILLIGSMNLSSFTSSDDGLRIGCSGRYQPGGTGAAINFIQTANLTAAEPVTTPDAIFATPNISQDSRIFVITSYIPSAVERSDTLTFNYALLIDGTPVETINSIPLSQADSTSFAQKFKFNTYYQISVSAANCVEGSVNATTKSFVLLGLRSDNGYFEMTPLNFSHVEIEWKYKDLMRPNDDIEEDYLPRDSFTFNVINNDTNSTLSLTELNLDFPYGFAFNLSSNIDSYSGRNILEIYFNGDLLARVPIIIREIRSNTLLIILIVIAVLLTVLLLIIIFIIISFVFIHFKRKRDSEK